MEYTFKSIGTAIAFSPTSKLILRETKILCEQFHAKMIIIHVGEGNTENKAKMSELLYDLALDESRVEIVYKPGEPVHEILSATKEYEVDLLVAGALKKEKFWNLFKSSVARNLCRKANCSLLILTEPKEAGTGFNSIVVNGVDNPKTKRSLKIAIHFASKMNIRDIEVIEEVDASQVKTEVEDDQTCDQAIKERNEIYKVEKEKIEAYLKEINLPHIRVDYKCLFGKIGYTIGHYSEVKRADLLVVNSPDSQLGFLDRLFPHDLEYLLNEMPTNLMIVK